MHLSVSKGYTGHNGMGHNGSMRRVAAVKQRGQGPWRASPTGRQAPLESIHSPARPLDGADSKIDLPKECHLYLREPAYAHVHECLAQHFQNTKEDLNTIVNLDREGLSKYGITHWGVQECLLAAFAEYKKRTKDAKSIWVERPDSEGGPSGIYDRISFSNARGFEVYSNHYMLFHDTEDGSQALIADYDDVEDQGRYRGFVWFRYTEDEIDLQRLNREAGQAALAFMKEKHDDAELLKPGAYANSTGQKQQLDVVVVARGCVLVTEAKVEIDLDAVEQLENKIKFVREAAADRAPDFECAWDKDIKGALAGTLPATEEQEAAVREAVDQHHWELFLLK